MSLKTSLTRDQMASAIHAGGVVQVGGKFFSRVEDLPSEADFAAASGDPDKKQRTAKEYDREIARLQAEKAKLETPDPAPADPKKAK